GRGRRRASLRDQGRDRRRGRRGAVWADARRGNGDRRGVLHRRGRTAGRRPGAVERVFVGGGVMPTLTYLQAISAALRDELRADERVLLMGEDIGVFGGAFKVTDGFVD